MGRRASSSAAWAVEMNDDVRTNSAMAVMELFDFSDRLYRRRPV
jgi:hypothetical protein